MALPGLSFEIVRSAGPVVGLRSDRTAMIALAERGPEETPVMVESYDELVEQFGAGVDGMLGLLLGKAYFDNGGQQLLVTRFLNAGARAAAGSLPFVGASGPGTLGLRARDRGEFGNSIFVEALLDVRKRAKGTRPAAPNTLVLAQPVFDAADLKLPVRLVGEFTSGTEDWMVLTALSADRLTLTFSKPIPADATSATNPVLIELHARTFTLLIRERGRRDIPVPNLDLTSPIATLRGQLESTTVTVASVTPAGPAPELPLPGTPVRLSGGTLAFADSPLQQASLRLSFERALAALEVSDQPDIVVAPDLWNRIFSTKGISTLTLTPQDSIELGDLMVQSAARTSDRVVLLDPPLVDQDGGVRPMTVSELETWRTERERELVENQRDFVAAYTPWPRIVAGPVYRGDDTLPVPPSLLVAGRMALTARERGPWNATGNVSMERVVALDATLSIADQERLQDGGINPLRMELPRGATIQGVRSLSWPDRKPWRFLSTRRLFNYLRRALKPIGLSYVFEPNSPQTWILLRRDVERLLRDLFAAGALAGATPEESFFVKVDEELNPPSERDNGVLNCLIGVAPAFPLEFLVVRLVVENGIAKVTEEPQTL